MSETAIEARVYKTRQDFRSSGEYFFRLKVIMIMILYGLARARAYRGLSMFGIIVKNHTLRWPLPGIEPAIRGILISVDASWYPSTYRMIAM